MALQLRNINREIDDAGEEQCDVRLQVYPDGEWSVRWGLSDYDQDHRGFWGASSIPGGSKRFDSYETARDLIDQAKEDYACSESEDA